tara:strand:+ start:185 stop:706 length:522 start_codon:yes stop_codon:yes gene_type:complete
MPGLGMAKAKTNTFYLRETIEVNAGPSFETMDLSVYVDPVNKQGLLIRNVDFIWSLSDTWLPPAAAAFQAAIQIHDTALGGMVDLENTHQVASGSVTATTSTVARDQDFFPDRLGMAKGEGRICVNDTLEIVTDGSAAGIPGTYVCTVVMEVQVVKLTEKDYISLALQQVADA